MSKFIEPDWAELEKRVMVHDGAEYYILREYPCPCKHGCKEPVRIESRVLRLSLDEMSLWISTIDEWGAFVGRNTLLVTLISLLFFVSIVCGIVVISQPDFSFNARMLNIASSFASGALSVLLWRRNNAYARKIVELLQKKRLGILARHGVAKEDGWNHAIPSDRELQGPLVVMPEKKK